MLDIKYYKVNFRSKGQIKYEILKSVSKIDAKIIFESKNSRLRAGKIEEVSKPLAEHIKDIKNKFSGKIDIKEYISILDNLSIMLSSDININKIISQIINTVENKKLKEIFTTLNNDLGKGQSFSKSLLKYEKDIGVLSITMFKLGETSGNMSEALESLAQTLKKTKENKDKLKKSTRYPIFLLFSMIIAFIVVIVMVIPEFQSLFKSFKMELPASTKFLLNIEYSFRNYWHYILIGMLSFFSILTYIGTYSVKGRYVLDQIQLKIYLLGRLIESAMIVRFIHVFNKLNKIGLPISESLELSSEIITNSVIKGRILEINKSITNGKSISNGFKNSKMFNSTTMLMIESGEESGNLEKMLLKVEDYYEKEYNNLIDTIDVYIEPLLIVSLLGFVAVLAFGIFVPLWNMADII